MTPPTKHTGRAEPPSRLGKLGFHILATKRSHPTKYQTLQIRQHTRQPRRAAHNVQTAFEGTKGAHQPRRAKHHPHANMRRGDFIETKRAHGPQGQFNIDFHRLKSAHQPRNTRAGRSPHPDFEIGIRHTCHETFEPNQMPNPIEKTPPPRQHAAWKLH